MRLTVPSCDPSAIKSFRVRVSGWCLLNICEMFLSCGGQLDLRGNQGTVNSKTLLLLLPVRCISALQSDNETQKLPLPSVDKKQGLKLQLTLTVENSVEVSLFPNVFCHAWLTSDNIVADKIPSS